jgi:hypothetical protein
MDFRPCPKSQVAALSAGAYDPWSATQATYWIPGRREMLQANTPLPPHASIGIHINTELMFLPAKHALSHAVHLGKAGGPLQHLEDLSGPSANIARPKAQLVADTAYEWRVDTTTVEGVGRGAVWAFLTGRNVSCQITPRPPPRPPPPGPVACRLAEDKYCPGLGGRGAKVGQPCEVCVINNANAFSEAGCIEGAKSGGRHSFIEKFCGPDRT